MKKITLMFSVIMLGFLSLKAQTSCVDMNEYVDLKNTGPTGYYTLTSGQEEKAAQTYYYNGPGKISSVRIFGNYPGIIAGVPLRVSIYDVDVNGRPTSMLYSSNITWWWFYNTSGYMDVNIGSGGLFVNSSFAVAVELRNASPWGNSFQVQYTGDGEGGSEDLPSLAGPSTGSNWSSALSVFNKDGDFYLVPRITNFINSSFDASAICLSTSSTVNFTNNSTISEDRMFNLISSPGYSGSNFIYTWDFGDGSPVSHNMDESHTYSTPGSYTVSLTTTLEGWNNTCSDTYTMDVSVGLGSTASSTSATCAGDNDGSLTVSANGGASPYEYSIDGTNYQSGTTFSGLTAGTYTVYVSDDLGCETSTTINVSEPSEIVISTISSTNSSCGSSNGAILVTASGGSGSLEYQLNSGTYQTSNSFTSLSSGAYDVNVMDGNGCIASSQAVVSDQGAPTMNIIQQINISCYGGTDGTINVLGTGGSGTLQYSIDGGINWTTTHNFTNLPAGSYVVMVKDAAGCSYGIRIQLFEPQPVSFDLVSSEVACNGESDGTITVINLTGGTGNFTYSLNGVNYQSGSTFQGVFAGTYVVYAKDAAGCMQTDTVTVSEPSALAGTASITNALCTASYDGEIVVSATGGTGDYMYSLNGDDFQYDNTFGELGAGSYTITLMDENGCEAEIAATITQPTSILATITTGTSTCGNNNGTMLAVATGGSGSGYMYSIDGTNFNSTGNFSSLAAGGYYVVITDGNNCTSVFHSTVNDADGPVFTSVSSTDVACNDGNDGSITVNTVTGGTGTLEYSINGTTWQTSTSFTALEAGVYNLIVKDANGCIGDNTITITEPNGFAITNTVADALCFSTNTGTATINAAGGSGTLAYSINGGITYVSSSTFNNLGAGNYTVIVRDAAGCTGETEFVIDEPAPITNFISVLNISCFGNADGTINVNAFGGTPPFEFSIDGTNYQSSGNFASISGGNYIVFIKDDNGCVKTAPITVIEPDSITINSMVSDVSCAGGNNGVINLSVSGGTAPYTYSWSNFLTSEDIFNLTSGNYNVAVTDNNGCIQIGAYSITEPNNPLIVNGTVTDAFNQMSTDGAIDITVTGGTPPYSFDWNTTDITEDITGLNPGVYSVTITDALGCTTSGTFIVSVATGIEENSSIDIRVYPNPARDNVTFDGGSYTMQNIEVLNMIGQTVRSVAPNSTRTDMNVSDLESGLYIIRITTSDNKTVIQRVEIVR